MYDIIVVGAGIAGATFSSKLAEKGFSTLLIERKEKEKVGEKICGDGIGLDVINNLRDYFGIKVSEQTILHKVNGTRIYSPSMKTIRLNGMWFLVSRPLFGQDLINPAVDNGAELLDNSLCTGLLFEDKKIAGVKVKNKEYKARLVIDATGAVPLLKNCLPENQFIPKSAGFYDTAVSYRQIVTLKKPIEDEDNLHVYFDLDEIPMGYFWIFPKGDSTVNIGAGNSKAKNPVEAFNHFVKKLNLEIKEVKSAGGGVIPVRRPLPSFVLDNFMMIGDSAFQCSPLHGGGIGNTIKASIIASRNAISALENEDLSVKGLWNYNTEYMREYGYISAKEELTKLFIQGIGNKNLNFLFSSGLTEKIRKKGWGNQSLSMIIPLLLNVPQLAKNFLDYGKRVRTAKKCYTNYPKAPEELKKWLEKDTKLFDEAKVRYGAK